jgi:predicted RNA-binding Zn-ribbon protein involved in translation (DUF1610 family)
MPKIDKFECDKCGFRLPMGEGGYQYVTNDAGEKVVCQHPCEDLIVAQVLGFYVPEEGVAATKPPISLEEFKRLRRERIGWNLHCVCLDCLGQFDLDLMKEERVCPKCQSKEVKAEEEMVSQTCPKCKTGIIKREWTGTMT